MEARALLRDILPVLWLHQGAGVLVRLAGQGDLKAPIRIVNPSMLELPMPWFEAKLVEHASVTSNIPGPGKVSGC